MKLLRSLSPIIELSNGCVATIGNFDGVHIGHQALLAALRKQADNMGLPMVVVLFEPQPGEYFQGRMAPARLSSLREKLHTLRKCGVDYAYRLKFDNVLSLMSAVDFAEEIIFSLLNVRYLLIGRDFRFGNKREGNVDLLTQLADKRSGNVSVFSDHLIANQRVSSTVIRRVLQSGDLSVAARLLGRNFSLCGRVIPGDGRGRQWGIPTANLSLQRVNLPLTGVFCVQVKRQDKTVLSGVANIGCRPTVDGSKNILEIHVLDFNGSLYGERLQVNFLHKLRDEKKFPTVDALITQIHNDIAAARSWFELACHDINFAE